MSDLIDRFIAAFITNDRWSLYLNGLLKTIEITIIALLIGLALGTLVAIVRTYHDHHGGLKILNVICKAYTTVIRGTPMMVQLLIMYLVVFASIRMDVLIVASLAFGLNSGAYVAEIIRAGINAVPKGQFEASRSLGLTFGASMTLVIIPQAIKNILPALANEGITLLKETSIAGAIGVIELTQVGNNIINITFDAMPPLLIVAGIYLIVVMILTYLVHRLEVKLSAS